MEFDYLDIDVSVPVHKSRANVMTVNMAIKHKKSSKNHKLKPRSKKRDHSKMADAKAQTLSRRQSLQKKNKIISV
jgi:hypothetical protein